MGQSLLLPAEVAALQNRLRAYNQDLRSHRAKIQVNGVIQIDGYDYIGYFALPVSPKDELYKSQRLVKRRTKTILKPGQGHSRR